MSAAATPIKKMWKETERFAGSVEREMRRHGGRGWWIVSPAVGATRAIGTSMSKMMEPSPIPPTPTPTPGPTEVGYASQAERDKRKRRKGYGSTILAGGELGVASTQRKQILG